MLKIECYSRWDVCGLVRKIFKVDEKLKESLRNDGYDDDLTDCSIAGE